MSIRSHALRMAKEAFRSRWRKHARSVTRSKYWTDRGQVGHPIEPYNKEHIKKLIRSVKHLDPRKVRFQKVKKPPGSRAPTISLVGKGWAGDVKSMQVPGITKLERRKLNKHIKSSVKRFLKQQPKIAKMSVKDRKRKYGFEQGGPIKLLRGALLTKGIKHAYKLYKRAGGQKTKKITSDLWRRRHPAASANIAERMKHPDFNALLKHRAKYLVAKDLKKLVKKGAAKHARYKDTKKLADYKMKQVMGTVQKAFGVQKAFKKPSKTTLHSTGGPVKLLRGALLTKGIRTGFKIFKKEAPQLFSKMKRSRLQLKADTKKIKTPELIPLGISKIKPDDLRKLTIAQGVKIKVKNQAKIALRHNRKAMPLLWSKAKSLKQVYKLGKYDKPTTQIKIDKFFKEHTKLESYINRIKSKSATKHSHGGEVVIHNNVDRSLL